MNNNAKRMMPNASIEQYYHYWLQNIPEKCDRGIVGYVRNYENPEIKITIEIDDGFMNERNHPNMCFYFEEKSYVSESEIVMTSDFFNHIYNNKALLAGLWHEIGHFHTLHYFDFKGHQNKEKKSINDYRNKLYESKKVAEEEYAADLFSVYYTSKEEWLQFKYAWRLNCQDGSEYGVDPCDYETREEYNEALEEAKEYSISDDYVADDIEEEIHEDTTVVSNSPFVLCRLSLLSNGRNIYAIPNDMPFKVGDKVIVQLSNNKKEEAIVLSVEQHTSSSAPPDYDNNRIISKL